MIDGLEGCPFCGETPCWEGDGANWKDEKRYVQMKLMCCVTMSCSISWMVAREMLVEDRTKEMKNSLTKRWNTRYIEDSDE